MNLPAPESAQRTRTLIETGLQEAHYLRRTDDRLFALPLSLDAISRLPQNDELSERIDAFVARFGRLQAPVSPRLAGQPARLADADMDGNRVRAGKTNGCGLCGGWQSSEIIDDCHCD